MKDPELSSREVIGKRPSFVTTNRCPPISLRSYNILVRPPGIEPGSLDFQSSAMTSLAQVANFLAVSKGIEPS